MLSIVRARTQAVERESAEAVGVRLSSSASLTRLDGFRSRAMRSEVPTTRHQYMTEWCTLDLTASEGGTAPMLMVSDEGMCGRGGVSGSVVHDALSAAMVASAWSVVVATVPAHRGHVGVESIFAVEMSLVLVQLQGARARGSGLWLLTIGEHGGRGAADAGSLAGADREGGDGGRSRGRIREQPGPGRTQ